MYKQIKILFSCLINNMLLLSFSLFSCPLFDYYPTLKTKLSYIELCKLPTPVLRASTLEKELNKNSILVKALYIKNDCYSCGNKKFGGNKPRKLEFLLADVKNKNTSTICTTGGAGSNSAIAVACHAKDLGIKSILVLCPQRNTTDTKRNLKLGLSYEAQFIFAPNVQERDKICDKLCKDNNFYFVPSGVSNKIGMCGFVNAAFELKEQIKNGLLPEPDIIYITFGTGGTYSGLFVGAKAAGLKSIIIPVKISPYKPELKLLETKITEVNFYLHELDNTFPIVSVPETSLPINTNFTGEEFSHITKEASDAIELLYKTEHIKLDGTFTGKAFAALLSDAQKGLLKDKNILFWNTFCSGDFTEETKDVDITKLPEELQKYITTYPLQPFDQGV